MTTTPSRDDSLDPTREPRPELSPAVRRVLVENRDRFLRFVRRKVGRPDVAEEILQDAIVRGLARGGTVQAEATIVPWFYRLLRNAIVDHLRSASSERRGLSAFERELGVRDDGADQDLIDSVCSCLASLIPALKPDYATALGRVELGGEPLGHFARATGISAGNAAVRLHRARRALRRAVDKHCGGCAEHGGYRCECQGERHLPG